MPNNNGLQRESLINKSLKRKVSDPNAPVNLKSSPRIHENIIQLFLFACGVLSILTTIGILFVLVQESLTFFNRDLWEVTNRPIAVAIDAEQLAFPAEAVGREIEQGATIRLNEEIMFLEEYTANEIAVAITGTGAGFDVFCEGQTDINNASRLITSAELASCHANNIEPLAFQLGIDAIAVVINASNTFARDITQSELQQLFNGAENWSDIRPEWANQPITRFIPDANSGTFDTFVDVVYDGAYLVDMTSDTFVTSEDDNQLVRGISNNPYAVGFFGYSYYLDNAESLSLVTIDDISPSAETVADGTYLLTRPLYIYTSEDILANQAQVTAFIEYYLLNAPNILAETGYFALSTEQMNSTRIDLLSYIGSEVTQDADGTVILPEVTVTDVSGNIHIAGSSTVYPITQQIAGSFADEGYQPLLTVTRGINDTFPEEHSAGTVIEVGDRVSLWEFFTHNKWQPAIRDFGIFPLIYGTLATSFIAMIVALPLGIGAAIYLSEYAPENVRNAIKPILEILAGIPTVVYGYFALTFMTPLLQAIFGDAVQIYNSTSAGIVVGILIVPMVSSMSEDALSAVPRALREASYGLGATKFETTVQVVIPAALSGIMAAFIVAISRAIGETMVVAIAAGAGPQNNIPDLLSSRGAGILFEPAETMTGHIARISGGDLSYNSIDYNSIFAIGLMLFVITFALNIINNAIIRRFREAY
mgnify:CR=1 FL=1